MKKSLISLACLILITGISCKKVSPRKLDGVWNVTSGTREETSNTTPVIKSTSEVTGLPTYFAGSTLTKASFDGSNEKGTTTFTYSETCAGCKISEDFVNPFSIAYTFDKKKGTYTKTTNETAIIESINPDRSPNYVHIYYVYNSTSGKYDPKSASIDRQTTRTTVTIETGTFNITGGSGDTKKNTQIIFQPTSTVSDFVDTYIYKEFRDDVHIDFDITGKYKLVPCTTCTTPTYVAIPAENSGTYSNAGKSSDGQVWTVSQLKKGSMDVSYEDATTITGTDLVTTEKTSKITWKLTKE